MLSISRAPTASTAGAVSPSSSSSRSSPSRGLATHRPSPTASRHFLVANRSEPRNVGTTCIPFHQEQQQQQQQRRQSPLTVHFVDRSLLLPLRARLRSIATPNSRGTDRHRASPCRASGSNGDGKEGPTEYSQEARLRQEVLNPFRTVRMFLYGAFIASASIGALITATALLAVAAGARDADPAQIQDSLKDLGIDVAAAGTFALLYRSDARGKDASLNRLTREESLAKLRLELPTGRIVPLSQLQGSCRLIIVAGPLSHVQAALAAAEPYRAALLERAVVVAPFVTVGAEAGAAAAGNVPLPGDFKGFAEVVDPSWGGEVATAAADGLLQRWMGRPTYTDEWNRWLKEQMKFANVAPGSPVYLSLRLDGRVRASGVGYPPWSVIAAQLPPMKGMWAGPLDGMDGRVL
ncbi:hypothetical protein CLOM_g14355 [Closterium sp. NIES-68]|nr:hypothetical protein CLOM_g14355 [Closterium sp. NIES-68]